jgi:hypothetical protein
VSILDELDGGGDLPVNAMDYFQSFGLSETEVFNVLLHLLFTRTYVMASDAREAAAELGIQLPYVHPGDDRMH